MNPLAVIPPRFPPTSVGLLMIVEDCVAIDEVEFERVGDEGRMLVAGGEGAADPPRERLEEVRAWWKGDGGAGAVGVFWVEGVREGCLAVGTSPL